MENLIIIEGESKLGFDSIEELVKVCINNMYYSMSKEEKFNELEKMAVANAGLYKIPVINFKEILDESKVSENVFVLYDEITHILSLAKIGKLVILEKTESNIFTKYIDKTNIQDNYVIVNKFVDEILSKYLSENRREKC